MKAFVLYNSFNSWGWVDSLSKNVTSKIEVFSGGYTRSKWNKRSNQDCSYVFHLAALIAIPYSYHSPDSYVDTNIRGTLNLCKL